MVVNIILVITTITIIITTTIIIIIITLITRVFLRFFVRVELKNSILKHAINFYRIANTAGKYRAHSLDFRVFFFFFFWFSAAFTWSYLRPTAMTSVYEYSSFAMYGLFVAEYSRKRNKIRMDVMQFFSF